jgi:hypothetical protein
VAALACGCSFVQTKSPAAPPNPPNCPPSKTPAQLDVLMALVSITAAVSFGIASDLGDKDKEERRATYAGLWTLASLGFSASAIVGVVRTRRCASPLDDWNAHVRPTGLHRRRCRMVRRPMARHRMVRRRMARRPMVRRRRRDLHLHPRLHRHRQ